ncbi:MAG: DUF1772 domain-containing protein [Solirubrobacterales bacterium]|jgi:uncharacterized membrane protein|nr:DUF1772 domain-containing protein [Solirubrobacterales bacterium]
MILKTARLANLVLAGVLTGNEFGSRVIVHPALGDLAAQEHLRAEQALTRRYGQIMPVMMTSTLASFLPVLALEPERTSRRSVLTAMGLACYAAMLAVTLTRNVPLNNRLLELSEDTPDHEFRELRARWDRLHTARNLLNITGLTCTGLAALSGE